MWARSLCVYTISHYFMVTALVIEDNSSGETGLDADLATKFEGETTRNGRLLIDAPPNSLNAPFLANSCCVIRFLA